MSTCALCPKQCCPEHCCSWGECDCGDCDQCGGTILWSDPKQVISNPPDVSDETKSSHVEPEIHSAFPNEDDDNTSHVVGEVPKPVKKVPLWAVEEPWEKDFRERQAKENKRIQEESNALKELEADRSKEEERKKEEEKAQEERRAMIFQLCKISPPTLSEQEQLQQIAKLQDLLALSLSNSLSQLSRPNLHEAMSTPLHCACSVGNLAAVQLLVHHGVDFHASDGYGSSPLLCAVQNKHAAIVEYLTSIGSDTNTSHEFLDDDVTEANLEFAHIADALADGCDRYQARCCAAVVSAIKDSNVHGFTILDPRYDNCSEDDKNEPSDSTVPEVEYYEEDVTDVDRTIFPRIVSYLGTFEPGIDASPHPTVILPDETQQLPDQLFSLSSSSSSSSSSVPVSPFLISTMLEAMRAVYRDETNNEQAGDDQRRNVGKTPKVSGGVSTDWDNTADSAMKVIVSNYTAPAQPGSLLAVYTYVDEDDEGDSNPNQGEEDQENEFLPKSNFPSTASTVFDTLPAHAQSVEEGWTCVSFGRERQFPATQAATSSTGTSASSTLTLSSVSFSSASSFFSSNASETSTNEKDKVKQVNGVPTHDMGFGDTDTFVLGDFDSFISISHDRNDQYAVDGSSNNTNNDDDNNNSNNSGDSKQPESFPRFIMPSKQAFASFQESPISLSSSSTTNTITTTTVSEESSSGFQPYSRDRVLNSDDEMPMGIFDDDTKVDDSNENDWFAQARAEWLAAVNQPDESSASASASASSSSPSPSSSSPSKQKDTKFLQADDKERTNEERKIVDLTETNPANVRFIAPSPSVILNLPDGAFSSSSNNLLYGGDFDERESATSFLEARAEFLRSLQK